MDRSRNADTRPYSACERAASFTLKTLDAESVALQSLHGSVVVLDLWATWCVPCRMEFPAIEKIRSEFGDAVRFYGISDESPATVKRFVEEHPYKMPMLLDGNREMHSRYGIHHIPMLFVIDRENVVRQKFTGTQNESKLREAIRSMVDQRASNHWRRRGETIAYSARPEPLPRRNTPAEKQRAAAHSGSGRTRRLDRRAHGIVA